MTKTIITYTNRKTKKEFTFECTINEGSTFVLIDNDGVKHLYSDSTIKKNFKKTIKEIEVDPPKKPKHNNFVDGERVNLRKDEADRVVTVRAFTGMLIGTFKVEKETKTTITVKTAKGHLKFDKHTGVQITDKKRFANRIDI